MAVHPPMAIGRFATPMTCSNWPRSCTSQKPISSPIPAPASLRLPRSSQICRPTRYAAKSRSNSSNFPPRPRSRISRHSPSKSCPGIWCSNPLPAPAFSPSSRSAPALASSSTRSIRPAREMLAAGFPGAAITRHDAELIHDLLTPSRRPTAVLIIPPFSRSIGRHADPLAAFRHLRSALMRLGAGGRCAAFLPDRVDMSSRA